MRRRAGIWDLVYRKKTKARVVTHAHDLRPCKVSAMSAWATVKSCFKGEEEGKEEEEEEKGKRKQKEEEKERKEPPCKTRGRRLGRGLSW